MEFQDFQEFKKEEVLFMNGSKGIIYLNNI